MSTMATSVTVNEPECKRIADRFSAIGEGLTGVGQDQNFCDGKAIDATGTRKDYPDLHWFRVVLQKGQALVSRRVAHCRDIWHGKQPEEFQKIHEEQDSDTVSGTTTETKGEFVVQDYLKINPSDIQFGEKIGKGTNAEVYEATWSRCRCAVKRFESSCMNSDYIRKLQMELDFLIQLRHPFLVQLMGLSVDSEHRCSIVMELMSCSLRGLIDSRLKSGKSVPFEFREAVMIMKKIALGMRFVHSKGVSHRDLKAANVMVEERPGSIDVKIADFGESQFMDPSKKYGTAGTMAWMAPEILPPVPTSSDVDLKAADVYSFAMTCFEVLSGEKPFSDSLNREQRNKVRSGLLRPVLPVDLDRGLITLIEACWDSKPEKRPNFEDICSSFDRILRFSNPTEVSELLPFCGDVVQGESTCNRKVHGEPRSGGYLSVYSVPEYLKINDDNYLVEDARGLPWDVKWLGCSFSATGYQFPEDLTCIKTLQREIDMMVALRHPHILQLVGITDIGSSQLVILTERMTSTLLGKLCPWKKSTRPPFDLHEAVVIMRKIALGMAFMHSKEIVHLHLTTNSVFLNESPGIFDVKIGKFRRSLHLKDQSGEPQGDPNYKDSTPKSLTRMTSRYGDLKAVDVYSFAMTCSAILTGQEPFEELKPFDSECNVNYIQRYLPPEESKFEDAFIYPGQRPTLPADLHPDLKLLIHKCWHMDPLQRPDFTSICDELQRIQQVLPNSSVKLVVG